MDSAKEPFAKTVPFYLENLHLSELAVGHKRGIVGNLPKTPEATEAKRKMKWDEYIAKMNNQGGKVPKRNVSYSQHS